MLARTSLPLRVSWHRKGIAGLHRLCLPGGILLYLSTMIHRRATGASCRCRGVCSVTSSECRRSCEGGRKWQPACICVSSRHECQRPAARPLQCTRKPTFERTWIADHAGRVEERALGVVEGVSNVCDIRNLPFGSEAGANTERRDLKKRQLADRCLHCHRGSQPTLMIQDRTRPARGTNWCAWRVFVRMGCRAASGADGGKQKQA